ncbi:hypothetical protein [Macrococcus capreoli]|uniref:hypothetical protein n=1 Tax=Macrococcus capreoli TaxID=2982690 RepID=UPI0021D58C32|nr:hypothetical protein [Macrococcus sp. TMW 2.2395]MCU7556170.1 hypothetical protein [Macrococcus sp. TMW 2.2395]
MDLNPFMFDNLFMFAPFIIIFVFILTIFSGIVGKSSGLNHHLDSTNDPTYINTHSSNDTNDCNNYSSSSDFSCDFSGGSSDSGSSSFD